MREEEKALRELEKLRQIAENEERLSQQVLEKARREVEHATGTAQEKLQQKIAQLEQQVAEAEAIRQRAISQAQLTKSGHIYVISNIGSFGQDVYKIGMTRRLEPIRKMSRAYDRQSGKQLTGQIPSNSPPTSPSELVHPESD